MLGNCKKGVSLRVTSVDDEGTQTNQCHFQALIIIPAQMSRSWQQVQMRSVRGCGRRYTGTAGAKP